MLHNRPTTAQSIAMVPMGLNFRSQSQLSSATVKYASVLFCALAVGLTALPASAEELTHDQMVCALDPQCVMPLVNRRLRGVAGSSMRITRGSFDRTINFAFDSAELTPLAHSELDQVAAVLKDYRIRPIPRRLRRTRPDFAPDRFQSSSPPSLACETRTRDVEFSGGKF